MPISISEFRQYMRDGEFAWPGGYQMYLVCEDGGILSYESARECRRQILASLAYPEYLDKQWAIIGRDINWEDPELYCDHSGKRIPPAYGE